MGPNFHQLRIFLSVAERGSFSKAAEELFISQPAVSAQVKDLERAYSTPLFYQIGRQIYLTEAGRMLRHYAKHAFSLMEEAERVLDGLKGLEHGHLIIAASTTPGIYMVPPLLGEFSRLYPGIQCSLDIGSTEYIHNKLLRNEADLGFVGRELDDSLLDFEAYKPDRLLVVAGSTHKFIRREYVELEELESEPFIMREPGSATRALAEAELTKLGVSLQVVMELGSPEAVKQAVAAGLGLTIASEHSIGWEVASKHLAVVAVKGLSIQRQLYLACLKGRPTSHVAQAFINLTKDKVIN